MSESALARMGPQQALDRVRVDTSGVGLMELCGALAKSGYFKDARDASQAVVKVLYGQELGIGPVSAMMGIHVIEGKPAPSANLLAAIVKRSGRYTYRVLEHTAEKCVLAALERAGGQWQELGTIEWSRADAERAGLWGRATWKSYPRQMLFSRGMSELVRVYFPELFGGAPVYTPEELGAEVDGEGSAVSLPAGSGSTVASGAVVDVPARVAERVADHVAGGERHESYADATVGAVTARTLPEVKAGCQAHLKSIGWADTKSAREYLFRCLDRPAGRFADLAESDWRELESRLGRAVCASKRLHASYGDWCRAHGHDAQDRSFRIQVLADLAGRMDVTSSRDLTPAEMTQVADRLQAQSASAQIADRLQAQSASHDPFAEE